MDAQALWGETLYRVWPPTRYSIVRIRAERLLPATDARISHQVHIVCAVVAAWVSDSLAHDGLLPEDPKLLMWYDQALTRTGGEL